MIIKNNPELFITISILSLQQLRVQFSSLELLSPVLFEGDHGMSVAIFFNISEILYFAGCYGVERLDGPVWRCARCVRQNIEAVSL